MSLPQREPMSAALAGEIAQRYIKTGIDWTTVLVTVVALGVIGVSSWAGWQGLSPLWLSFLINIYFMFALFTTSHEASHGNIGRGRSAWLNTALAWVSGSVNLVPYRGWGDLHGWHHTHVNDAQLDPDDWVKGKSALSVLFRAATMPPHYVHFYLQSGAYRQLRGGRFGLSWLLVCWTFAIGVSALVWALTGNYTMLVLWPLAAYMSTFVMGMMLVWYPHFGSVGRSRTDSSTTYEFRGLKGVLMRPFDLWQSYHVVHHAFPRVPCYRQGKVFAELRHYFEAEGATIIDI